MYARFTHAEEYFYRCLILRAAAARMWELNLRE